MSQTFADYVLGIAGSVEESPEFPQINVCDEGDCIEIFFAKDNYYAERIDKLVTVYLLQSDEKESSRIVGVVIKNVKSFICHMANKSAGFRADVKHRELQLSYLLAAIAWSHENEENSNLSFLLEVRDLVDSNETARTLTIPSEFACA